MARIEKKEVEVKLKVADPNGLRRLLLRLGARGIHRVFEKNDVYDTPKGDLRRTGRLLRLRTVEEVKWTGVVPPAAWDAPPGALLTYKAHVPLRTAARYKVKREIEARVDSRDALDSVFAALGLRPMFRYEKFRHSYRLPRLPTLHIELDETPMGTFLELEGARSHIDRVARWLGYLPRDYITATYAALFRRTSRGRRGNMVFPRRKK